MEHGEPEAPAPAAEGRDLHIAIIGMSGRFPGAQDIPQFWDNLCKGVESITFFSDEELLAAGHSADLLRRPDCVKAQGVLAGCELFDADFFGYTRREAEIIDPQQRMFLETAYQALADAGYTPESHGGQIGIFAGASMNTYYLGFFDDAELRRQVGGILQLIGNNRDFLTTRVSYKLGLKGPSVTVQTACSTSLVAVHLAVQSLLNGECEVAMAGGVSLCVPQETAYLYQPGGIQSNDGHCRAFDARAAGTASGSGVGVVVLKRLAEALADGDSIHAVIRGSAINNDGADKVGFTAPSVAGQAAVIAEALHVAAVDPRTIGYVETHGTATPLGDPIELAALHQAFATVEAPRSCALGSVKSNIGHLDTAAGIAGLIKAALAVRHGVIPRSLHFERPNPEIDFAAGPFYVSDRLHPWRPESGPRRAGVSSFGLGGTNAHLVLEEAPPAASAAPSRPWQLLVLSDRSPESRARAAAALADRLEGAPDLALADAAYTLQVGRRELRHRLAVLCRERDAAVRALREGATASAAAVDAEERPLLFLFPDADGGGAAGRALYAGEAVFREEVDRWAEIFAPLLGTDLRRHFRGELQGDPRARRAALFAVESALACLLARWGVRAAALLGQGLGELVAAELAGELQPGEAARLAVAHPPAGSTAALRISAPLADLLGRPSPILLELGPVNGLATSVAVHPACSAGALALGALREEDEMAGLLGALGELWVRGVQIRWPDFYAGERRRRISLPPTPLARQRYWIERRARRSIPSHGGAPALPSRPWQLLVLSAPTAGDLEADTDRLARYLAAGPPDLAHVAASCQALAEPREHRRALVCRSAEEAASALAARRGLLDAVEWQTGRDVAFLLPGVGDHYPGMARELYRGEPLFRVEMERCFALLSPLLDLDLEEQLYPEADEAVPEPPGRDLRQLLGRAVEIGRAADRLRSPELAQPAVFAVEYALARLWMSWGVRPAALLGYSLGEYTAACLAGVFSLEEALLLVAERSRLIRSLPEGGMVAVSLAEPELRGLPALSSTDLALAATYTPGVCVMAGPLGSVAALERELDERAVVHRRLNASHALHSRMMEPIAGRLVDLFAKVDLKPPRIPYVSNVTGTWIRPEEATDPAYWARHLCGTVRFAEGLERLFAGGAGNASRAPVLLEVGPGQALAIAARQHPRRRAGQPVVAALPEAHDRQSDAAFVAAALGRLWLAGAQVDWAGFQGGGREPLALPLGAATEGGAAAPLDPRAPAAVQAPQGPLRSRIQAVLAEILDRTSGVALDAAALATPFPELGLHSLMLMQLSQAVQQSLGVEVLFRQMFEELTSPAALLDYLAERVPAGWGESAPPPPPAAPDSVGDPILARVDALARDLEALRRSLAGNGAARAVATFTPPAPPAPAAPLAPVVAGPWRPRGPERERSLSPRQERHLARLVERYVRRTAESKRLAQKNRAALADVRVSLGFRRLWKELVYPITVERSAGSRLWDVDDNEHIDLLMGFGVDLLGHSPPFVTAALAAQLARGVHLGPQSRLAGEVAERFCSLTGTERATFCNTGSEAVLIALRLARTVSRRDKIAFFRGAYHGLNDPVLAGLQGAGERRRVAPLAPGIPPAMVADSMVLELGDPEALAWIERHAGILGAVLVEPVQASRPTLVLPEFLRELRALTARLDIPLIFDEMITGFRAHPAGIQGLLGIQADLATYGKVVGGGMPIGLVGGRSRFLDAVDGGTWSFGDDSSPTAPQTYIAGTFSKHPLALAAALPVLEHLADRGPALQEDLNRRTADLVGELNGYFSGTGLPIRVEHFASLFQFVFAPELELSDLFQYHLLEHGVHLWGSRRCFLSTAHSDEDLRRIVAAVAASIGEMQEGELLPTPAAELRGPIPAAPAAAPRGPEPEALSLTENQRALWFLSQVGEEASRAYIEAQALRLAGPLDGEALARAWERVVGRHEALRARIAADGESQEILTEIPVVLPRIELADLPAPFGRREARRCLREIARRPFDLSRAPLWRLLLLRLDAREHLLALAFHHLIIDDWSLNVIFDELCRGYNAAVSGKADDLPPAASYRDYVRARTVPERQAADEAYWLDVFTPPPPALALPTDLPRPPLESFSGQREVRRLDAALLGELRRQSGRAQGTLLMSLLAGFALLLHRLTGEEDLVVGVPAAGQAALPGGRLVGYCIRMLPIRSRLRPGRPFGEHLAEIRRAVLDAAEHQDYSLARLVRRLGGERDPSRPPLVAASFNMDSTARVGVGGQGFLHLAIEEVEVPVESAKLDLGLNLVEEGAGMRATLEFRDDLFRRTTACRWLAAFEALLRAAVGAPGTAVAALPLLAAAEQQQILVEWTDTATDPPGERCLHELLAGAAAARPEAIAVVEGDRQWSRGEIECRAERLAERLRRLGVGPEGLVGLCLERSARMVVALLAVLKAGGAYLPLDPSYPPQRVAFMLADSGALWVLTEERWRPLLAGYAGTLLSLDSLPPAPAAPLPPPRPADPGNRAYVLYTSGSTGRPKGVEVVHRGLTNLLTSMARQPGLGVGDALVAVTTLSFDIAGLELYLPLLTGARLVLARREDAADGARLAALLDRCGATAMQATPATWRLLLAAGWRGRPRLAALCGGEALPRELAGELLERSGALWNLYGPTETTVYSTGERVAPGPGAVPLGRPIANTVLRLLDRGLEPVPLGVVGELYVGGAGLARGYLGQPGLTADRFVPAPLGETTGERLYRTGDLARLRADGTLEFLGRADHQVKLRGVRIELGEIEAVLGETSVVAAAAVAVREVAGDRRLVAYVVPAEAAAVGDPEAWNEALRAALRRRLPGYMIPAAFVHLPALPLTANGKVDRRALPTADAAPPQPPRGGLEQALAGIWCEVLGIAAVGTRESFFEVGGHSLLVPRLLALLRERLGVELSIRGLFATPSVVALAARLADGAEIPAESTDLAELRADVVLDPDLRPRSPRTEGRLTPRALFLTGATGFVGAFLLAELLATTPAEVHCLVRADDEAGARERLRRQLVAYRLWHPWMEPRIVPVPGDLGRPRFGLSPDAFERLAGLLDGIYHCGAWVNFTYPYTMLRASNVGGAREALRLAVAGRLKPVHHISTLGVLAGSPEDGEWREDAPLPAPDGLVEGYAQSKWVAERILQLAQDRGVPVAVYRLGLVGGHSRTGVSNPRDLVWVWLKGMVRMEAATAAMDDLDLAPVDYVCRAIVHLSLQEGALGRTFHLNNPRPLPPEEVLDVLESLGYRLRRLPAEEWGRKVREELRRDPDHPLGPFAPLFASTAPAGPETKKYDDRNTREGLAGSGIACPPVDPELLARALRFLIETGFLPPPPGEGAAVAASLRSSPSPYPPATPWA